MNKSFLFSATFIFAAGMLSVLFIGGHLFAGRVRHSGPLPGRLQCPVFTVDQDVFEPWGQARNSDLTTQLDAASRRLESAMWQIGQTPNKESVPRLQELAGERKSLLIQALYHEPATAIFSILAPTERVYLAAHLHNCVESDVTVEGTIEMFHSDRTQGPPVNPFLLKKDDGEVLTLHPVSGVQGSIESGTRVRIRGFRIDNELVFNGSRSIADSQQVFGGGLDVIRRPGNPPVVGVQNTLVILAYFQGTTPPGSITQATANTLIFTNINNFYRENSYNIASLSGKVFGWMQMQMAPTCPTLTDISKLMNIESAAMQTVSSSVDFTQYTHLLVIANYSSSSCANLGGQSTIGKTYIVTPAGVGMTMSESLVAADRYSEELIAHELGHGFSNGHASFLSCGSLPIADYDQCTVDGYGDHFDVMGNTNTAHFSAFHKANVGWLQSGTTLRNVTTSGTYVLEPYETASGGLKALELQRDSSNDFLWIEYRQPLGADATMGGGTNVFNGALVHVNFTKVISGDGPHSYLINPSVSGGYANAALLPGQTITDPLTKAQVKAVSASSTGLAVAITIGKTDFTPPTITLTSPLGSSTLSGMAVVSANASDASGIQKVEFYASALSLTSPFATVTGAPYATLLDTTKLPNGYNYILARAYDLSGVALGVPDNTTDTAVGFMVSNGGTSSTPTPSPTPTPAPTMSPSTTPTTGCINPSPAPTGYALPCPELSLSAYSVPVTGSSLGVTAIPPAGVSYIYTTAYVYNGSAWMPQTLVGSSPYAGYSNTISTLTLPGSLISTLPVGANYVAEWDWTWNGSCYVGPGATACNQGSWRLQKFMVQ